MISFKPNKSITLLILTSTDVIRADFSGGHQPQLRAFAHSARQPGTYVTTAAELAVSLVDAKPSQRTIVVSDEFWTGILDIDDRSIYGLEGDELNQMLKFETESMSNLDPMNSHLGVVELAPVPPDTRRFWCTGVAGDVLHSIAATVAVRGGKLIQLAHPIGLSPPTGANGPWIEFHPTLAGAFASTAQGLPRASIVPRSRQTDRWFRTLETNFGGNLPTIGWIGSEAEAPATYDGELRPLDGQATLESWSSGVAQRLVGPDQFPVVIPPAPETSQATYTRISIIAATAAVLLCGADYLRDSWTKSSIQQQMTQLQEPAEEKKRLDTQLRQLNDQVDKLHSELQAVGQQQAELQLLTQHSDRFAELLRLIALGRDEALVVDQITLQPTGLQLSGRSIRSDSANQLALTLTPPARPLGWNVSAPRLEGENKLVNGGPWKFSIDLVDAMPAADAADNADDQAVADATPPITLTRASQRTPSVNNNQQGED